MTSTRLTLPILTMAVAGIGAVFNIAVILAIIIDPLKTLRKGAWITILNLAMADFLSCIACFCVWGIPFFTVIRNSEPFEAFCTFAWGFGTSASLLMLTFFTVQIYVITKFPLKSRFMFSERKTLLVTIAVWLCSIPLGLSYISYLYFEKQIKTNFKIWAARIGILQIALLVQIILNVKVTIEIIKSGRNTGNESSQNKKHRNIAKTVIILTLILFFTAFPYFLFKQIEFIVRHEHLDDNKTSLQIAQHLSYYYAPIALLNFTANPILYSLRLPDYRRTLLAFVGKSKRKNGGRLKTTPTTSLKLTQRGVSSQRTTDTRASPRRNKRCSVERSFIQPASSSHEDPV